MKYVIHLLLLIATAQTSYAQSAPGALFPAASATVLCLYKLHYLPDSTASTQRTEVMRLYSGSSTSKFVSNGTFLFDSLEATVTAPGAAFNGNEYGAKVVQLTQSTPTNFRFKIYKDFTNKQLFNYERVWSTLYKYQQGMPLYQWSLGDERAVVNGYACQRATTSFAGRRYSAWFTREVAIADGPYKFCGLPGLIVKVEDTRGHYSFELIKLSRLKNPFAVALPEAPAQVATRQTLAKAREDLKVNMPNMMSAAATGITPEDKLRMRNKAKRDNNAIELR